LSNISYFYQTLDNLSIETKTQIFRRYHQNYTNMIIIDLYT